MALETVRVPVEMQAVFEAAEEVVSLYFRDRRDMPERGTIEVFGERYVLVRAASLSVEFFSLARDLYGPGREPEADEFARNILFDLAHELGRSDAQAFHAKMGLHDPIARLSAGPVLFSHTGWAFVDISGESRPSPGPDFYLLYDHPYSFESDAWLRTGRKPEFPVCIMNSGYSSGWCEESFGVKLVAAEVLCRARGDTSCRFVMAPPDKIETHVEAFIEGAGGGAGRARTYTIPNLFARKRIEEELRRARDELEHRVQERTAELRASTDRLVREMAEREAVERRLRQTHKLEAVGRLAGGIAHDFNNLMGVVIGHASMLERRLDAGDPMRAQLGEIVRAGQRAAGLTQQLLAFSRAQVLQRDVLDPNDILAALDDLLGRLLGEDVELDTRVESDAGYVLANRDQFEQLVVNLAVNARDAMPSGGMLTIATRRVDLAAPDPLAPPDLPPGQYVMLAVKDTGVGMDEATMSQIFDPFFTTKEEGRGTGLGLSTVYGIARQAGGGVAVTSAPGRGSEFRVYLPRVERRPPGDRLADSSTSAPTGHETILLVEDQRAFRAMVREVLASLGYSVLVASDAPDAVRIARTYEGAIQVLLTDVVMPKMSGPQVADAVAALRPGVRVLYMSGYADDAVLGAADLGPGAAFVHKPFAPDVLARRLRALLDARGVEAR
jgi:signal transduction histidine kinase/ActR/RegA family two-component response regulator